MLTFKRIELEIDKTRTLINDKNFKNLTESELHCNLDLLKSVRNGLKDLELKLEFGLK
jgi:hypothetical protein